LTESAAFNRDDRRQKGRVAMDWALAGASFGIGIVVGLTGMGGGALMTPVLVLFFNIPPLAAVSSDLVSSAVLKPVGSFVHLRKGTVNLPLVGWLCVGSVPSAFCGVLIARALGSGDRVETIIQKALATALLIAAAGLIVRAYLRLVEAARVRDGLAPPLPKGRPQIKVRPIPTVIVGVVGGVVVGITSVGSGSIMIISLMTLYPTLRANELVGTDLAQSVPLIFSAAAGHLLFGDFSMPVTTALILGGIPGTYLGARLSSTLPSGLIRRALAFVLFASALKTYGVGNELTLVLLALSLLIAPPLWMITRRRHGFPARARNALATPRQREAIRQRRRQQPAADQSRRPVRNRSPSDD
jgi:uncharacterized protein